VQEPNAPARLSAQAELSEQERQAVAALVRALGEAIAGAYAQQQQQQQEPVHRRRPPPELRTLVAATAFDDLFKDRGAPQESQESAEAPA
jgi:hypothetical protein